jgi:hypothetical protein
MARQFLTDIELGAQRELRFEDADSSAYVGFKSPATVTTNLVWTLPATDGTTGQVLSTNGSAVLSWATASGGSVTIGTNAADVLSADAGEITANDAAADKIVFWDDSADELTYLALGDGVAIDGTTIYGQDWFVIAVSDESTNLATGPNKVYFRMPYAGTLLAVRASVNTAPTDANIEVDIYENTGGGPVSVLSTVLSIDASEKTSTTAAVPAVISDSALADDAEITIDIDQVGSTVAGKGLKVYMKVRRG